MIFQAAVIGLGNIGFKFSHDEKRKGTWSHVDAYSKCPATNLVGAVEIDQNTIDLFHSTFPKIPVYPTVKALFTAQHIDIVSICVPTQLHFPLFKEIIEHDTRAIFCEKPLSGSVNESEQMVSLAKEKNIVLAVNYTRRWQNSFILVKNMVNGGKIGNLRTITAYYPGRIFNIGSHLFDTVRMISKIQPVSYSAVTIQPGPDPSISGWIYCNQSVFFSFIATGKREDLIFEIDIIGDEGRIKILENGEIVEYYQFKESNRYSSYRELVKEEIPIIAENDRFVEAISNIVHVLEGSALEVLCSGHDGLAVDMIIDAILRSSQLNGKPVYYGTE
jgi:predicted dehydrogenase